MKVGIVGLGLIGGSIGLKLKDLYDNITIYGCDIDHDSVSYCCLLYTSPSPRDQ